MTGFEQNGNHFGKKPLKIRTKWQPFCLDLQCFGFGVVGTIAIALAMIDVSKTKPFEILTSKHLVFQCLIFKPLTVVKYRNLVGRMVQSLTINF